MPKFVLNRNYVLRSLSGHVVDFKKGEETFVPDAVVKEVVAIGAERTDAKQDALVTDESDAPPPLTQEEKEKKILVAIDIMMARNNRGDFSGSGTPALKNLSHLVGFEVDMRLRDQVWQKYLDSKNDDK